MIGGLACQSAAVGQGPEPEADVGTKSQVNASPQVCSLIYHSCRLLLHVVQEAHCT